MRIYDKTGCTTANASHMEPRGPIIGEVKGISSRDLTDVLEINGKKYSFICGYKTDYACVKELPNQEPETCETGADAVCPYCGNTIEDTSDWDNGIEMCPECGAWLNVEITRHWSLTINEAPEVTKLTTEED